MRSDPLNMPSSKPEIKSDNTSVNETPKTKRGIFDRSISEHRERVAAAKPLAKPADVPFVDMLIQIDESVKLPVRRYVPKKGNDIRATLFYIPGTAFVANETQFTRVICSHICELANVQIFVINHRLAPENQYPFGFNDSFSIYSKLVKEFADSYCIDLNRIAICGYSSGGTFAAQIALKAKEEKLPLQRQILVSPIIDFDRIKKGFEENEEKDTDISDDFVRWFMDLYLPESANPQNPAISPFWHPIKKLSGLPTTDIIVAEYDRFRGDAEAYLLRLAEANVDVYKHVAAGEKHSYLWWKLEIVEKIAELLSSGFQSSYVHHAPLPHTFSIIKPRPSNNKDESKALQEEKNNHSHILHRSKL